MTNKNDAIISAEIIPIDPRHEFKWKELIKTILVSPVGESQTVEFNTEREAKAAQNTVRDDINLHLDKVCIRTRCKLNQETGKWIVVFTRLQDRIIRISTDI
jgi:hypothetical protein